MNLARQSLHSALSSSPSTPLDFSALSEAITKPCDLDIYDIVIQLKPLQVPSIKDNRRRADGEEEDDSIVKKSKVDVSGSFPVVDFDPVGLFLEELRITFGHFADFYYGRSAGPVIGVKLRPFVVDQVWNSGFGVKCGLFNVRHWHNPATFSRHRWIHRNPIF